ncbi:MAG: cysteine--tRNA ligase, partial [Planctomycetales bacterium]
ELTKLLRGLNRFIESENLEDQTADKQDAVGNLKQATGVFRELAGVLGLFRVPVPQADDASEAGGELTGKLMDLLIELRADLRKAKNFEAADKVRNSLEELGVVLEDRPGGTDWSIK